MNKRGISAIVASVMIILITVALVAILWSIIIPLINEQLAFAEQCRKATTNLVLEDNCRTATNVSTSISRRSEEFNLVDIQYILTSDYQDYLSTLIVTNWGFTLPGPNERRRYSVNLTNPPVFLTMQIAPVVNVGRKLRYCDASKPVEVKAC